MTRIRYEATAELALGMRAPLARIELAASRLAREARTPGGRALAASISESVAELDESIGRSLALLARETEAAPAADDLRAVLADLHRRLSPALEARGVQWAQPTPEALEVRGDAALVRRLAVMLVREGAGRAGAGGAIGLSVRGDAEGYGVELAVRRARAGRGAPRAMEVEIAGSEVIQEATMESETCGARDLARDAVDPNAAQAADAALQDLLTLILPRGGRLERRGSAHAETLQLWLPRSPQCGAS